MDSGIVRRPPFGSNPVVGERGSDTRRRVLDAALEVFGEVAFADARVEQITERAGCSRPAFYQYFSSKDEVVWTLAAELGRDMRELADQLEPISPDEQGLATLTRWIESFMSLHDTWAPVFRAFPDSVRDQQERTAQSSAISNYTAQALLRAFGLPGDSENQAVASCLVGMFISCSFYADTVPAGMSLRPLVLGLARMVHRVLGGPVDGVNFKRGRSTGRRRVKIVAPVEPSVLPELRARGERTRRVLLAAGAKVLLARGYHEARVDDIVEAAGVSHGTFYRYFDSKDDFFRVLAGETSTRLVDLVERFDLDASADVQRAWIEDWFAAYEADGGVISTWQDMRFSPGLVGLSEQIAASVFTRIEKLLDQRDFGHPQVASAMFLALLELAPYRAVVLDFSDKTAEIDATLTIIRRGFLGLDDR